MPSRSFYILITVTVSLLFSCRPSAKSTVSFTSGSEDEVSQKIHLVVRKGDYFEKGKIYGMEVQEDIHGQLKIWEKLCKDEIGLSLDELYDVIEKETGFLKATRRYTPEFLEEISGMALGAKVSEKHLLTLNLAEEVIVFFSHGYHSCTNIALQAKEANILAYNLDLPDFLLQFKPVVLKEDSGFTYAFPGIIATGGINKYFAVTTNSLPELMMDTNGLPLPFMIRKLLTFNDEETAVAYLKKTPLATPQNIMIVGKKGVYDFECSRNGKVRYQNPKATDVIYHTNHALRNTDFNPDLEKETVICERFTYLERVFADSSRVDTLLTVESLIGAIDHRPSKIRYDGNYLSFLATFPKHQDSLPKIEILVPKDNGIENLFKFN